MAIEIKVPSPGESITQVQLAAWLVSDGDVVEKDAEIAEIDSDKATLSIPAEESGKITLMAQEGDTLDVGAVICSIDTSVKPVKKAEPKKEAAAPAEAPDNETEKPAPAESIALPEGTKDIHISPLAKKMMAEEKIDPSAVIEHYGSFRISRKEVEDFVKAGAGAAAGAGAGAGAAAAAAAAAGLSSWGGTRDMDRKKMSTLRIKLAERLVSVKNETAMLTTFNEVNMSPVMGIRKQYKENFKEKFGVSLGFMSFFTKAVTEALNHFPAVNAMIDGDEVVYHKYADIGIAVSAPKGLVVPVIRNAETLNLAEIETRIKELAGKARANRITLDEMTGGTFTITNGGVFGSMLSTPIINPPQTAILGMHNIVERPIAVNGQVEIHPIMYVALSYDHRIIDGRESVGFLVKVKEMLENPVKMMFGGDDPVKRLLNL